MNKVLGQCKENSSQEKRRRMLLFIKEAIDPPFPSEDMSSLFLKSKERIDSFEDVLHEVSRWESSFEVRESYLRTPTKLDASVAYPFSFVKPFGVHGDVTLKDINQRIHSPPPSKSQQGEEDALASYSTSAFSGKPVVGKTTIRTEGGQGSITILRTKG